jgi:hypothetical protein
VDLENDREVLITLTAEEAKALQKGLRELTFNTGAHEANAQRAVLAKLKAALSNPS